MPHSGLNHVLARGPEDPLDEPPRQQQRHHAEADGRDGDCTSHTVPHRISHCELQVCDIHHQGSASIRLVGGGLICPASPQIDRPTVGGPEKPAGAAGATLPRPAVTLAGGDHIARQIAGNRPLRLCAVEYQLLRLVLSRALTLARRCRIGKWSPRCNKIAPIRAELPRRVYCRALVRSADTRPNRLTRGTSASSGGTLPGSWRPLFTLEVSAFVLRKPQ